MGMDNTLLYLAMVIVQFAQVGMVIAAKVAIANGMSTFTFIFYSNAAGSIILLPICFFIYRSTYPPLLLTFVCGFFLLGFIGFLVQIFGYTGLMYSSASVAVTILNLIPGFTFVFAIILRMEKFNYRSPVTVAKSVGTVVSVFGSLIVTLYQGPVILGISPHSNDHLHTLSSSSAWLIGGVLLTVDSMLSAIFIIAQALILKRCPAVLILMLFYSCFIAILSAIASFVVREDRSVWSLKSTTRLLPLLYSALFGNIFQISIIMWCVRKRGPLFASVFHPVGFVFSTAAGIVILGEAFYLGSLLGAVVVMVGFYAVMWGKAKEADAIEEDLPESFEPNGERMPLLENTIDDDGAVSA